MRRTQLLLDDWLHDALRALADRRGTSVSAVVREIVSRHLGARATAGSRRLADIDGVAEGPARLGEDHDRFLYGAPDRGAARATPRRGRGRG